MAHGFVVVVRRTGAEGSSFPVVADSCTIGRHSDCDVRVQLPTVSRQHCRVDIGPDGQALLRALAGVNPPLVNGEAVTKDRLRPLRHGDMFTVGERTFRWRYPEGSPLELPPAAEDQPLPPCRRGSSGRRAGEKEDGPGSGAAGDLAAGSGGLLWLGLGVVTVAVTALLAVCARRPLGLAVRLDRA